MAKKKVKVDKKKSSSHKIGNSDARAFNGAKGYAKEGSGTSNKKSKDRD